MRIGILSMHRVNNYGSFWQAYCLRKLILNYCDKVEFIDIIPGEKFLPDDNTNTFWKKISLSKLKRIPYYFFQIKKNKIFKKFQKRELNIGDELNYSTDYDSIIIGSDEVFNCIQKSPWGFSSQLYGDIKNNNVSSYAGSFGYTTLENIKKYGLSEKIANSFLNMKNISVRDSNSTEIILDLLPSRNVYRHLDPVLIGDLPIPSKQDVTDKYILIYAYDFRFSDNDYIEIIKNYANKNNYKIYSIGFYQNWVDKNIVIDPYELLQYFKNAEYIITDTFHGTIFSIRCMKKFVTIIRDTNSQKLSSLLESVNLQERIVNKAADFIKIIEKEIAFESVNEILKSERNKTEKYIEACIRGEIYTDER